MPSLNQSQVQPVERSVNRQRHKRNEVIDQAKNNGKVCADYVAIGTHQTNVFQGIEKPRIIREDLLPSKGAQEHRNKERRNNQREEHAFQQWAVPCGDSDEVRDGVANCQCDNSCN